jgi:K+/H+ antiporter YhaU regulatory subunit KhtT
MATARLAIPPDSALVGKTIAESGLRSKTGALILSIRREDTDIATPDADFRLAAQDILVIVGQPAQLRAAGELVEA